MYRWGWRTGGESAGADHRSMLEGLEMKAGVREVRQDFAFVTGDGELILLDELVREVHGALEARGVQTDLFPLRCMIVATRTVTEMLASGARGLPSPDELCRLVAQTLRAQRIIASPHLIRLVLEEYLRQLQRLDIAQVQYY